MQYETIDITQGDLYNVCQYVGQQVDFFHTNRAEENETRFNYPSTMP
jgi:hypothetical protein